MNIEAFLTWSQMMTSSDKMLRKERIKSKKKAEEELKKRIYLFFFC
jgi:hypothetical protein